MPQLLGSSRLEPQQHQYGRLAFLLKHTLNARMPVEKRKLSRYSHCPKAPAIAQAMVWRGYAPNLYPFERQSLTFERYRATIELPVQPKGVVKQPRKNFVFIFSGRTKACHILLCCLLDCSGLVSAEISYLLIPGSSDEFTA